MTYLEYIRCSQAQMSFEERAALALHFYADSANHPQRLAFDGGKVAREVLAARIKPPNEGTV